MPPRAGACSRCSRRAARRGGVYLEGLKYPQHGFTLRDDYPMGVSNEFTGVPARVAVTDGLLLVAWTGEAIVEA